LGTEVEESQTFSSVIERPIDIRQTQRVLLIGGQSIAPKTTSANAASANAASANP